MLDSCCLEQHVTVPTHRCLHTLDLIITRKSESIISDITADRSLPSDHFALLCSVKISRPSAAKKIICFRKLRDINIENFRKDISESSLVTAPASDVESLCDQFHEVLSELLDRHAPKVTKSVTLRPFAPWYNDEIRDAKRERRRCERQFLKSGLQVHKDIYQDQCRKCKELLNSAKSNFHRSELADCDPRQLFRAVDKLCSSTTAKALPSRDDPKQLADDFARFFVEKIEKVKDKLDNISSRPNQAASSSPPTSEFSHFTTLAEETIRKIVMKSPSSSCALDCIPTWLLKACISELLPSITRIVNLSLQCGIFPSSYKIARITPLIKKPSHDAENLSNYRPISNLTFISKVIERAGAAQLQDYLCSNGLYGNVQSAYRKDHSTETALLRVQNDILRAIDFHKDVVLVLLDLSAAFDTVNHQILLQRLRDHFGICSTALSWFTSYLTDRKQCVAIGDAVSGFHTLDCGVPQGSVFGPLEFTLYTAPVEDIMQSHGVQSMIYADDTQLYLIMESSDRASQVSKLEDCVREVKAWTIANKLLLNDTKTEVVHLTSRFLRQLNPIASLTIGSSEVDVTDHARNLGVVMDKHMTLSTHINNICRSASYAIFKIGQIRRFIDQATAERLVHAFVTSRLDANNSLLYGLPNAAIAKLQRVQNSAIRLVTCVKRDQDIDAVRRDLHWLPIRDRIVFKLLLITYKIRHGRAPEYLAELVKDYTPARTLRSTAQNLLELPSNREVATAYYGKRAFSVSAPSLWNKLPLKGALDKFNIIPQLFPKKVGIFIPSEVLAREMTACRVLRSRLTYF